ADRIEHLGAEHELIADARSLLLQPAPDPCLAAAAAVGVGGIEHVDAGLERAVHQGERLFFGLAHPEERRRASDPAAIAPPERQPRYLQPGSSATPILHPRRVW